MSLKSYPTVLHAYFESLESNPEQLALRVVERSGEALELSFAGWLHLAARAAGGLKEAGVRRGDRLVIALPTCREFFALYLGALFSGVVPLMEPVPRVSPGTEYNSARLSSLLAQLGARHLVVSEAVGSALGPELAARSLTAEQLLSGTATADLCIKAGADEIAHLQLTSGSTGRRRIAIVRHRNLVANIAGIGSAIRLQPDDSLAFWLPMFHDMGLIAVSCSIYWRRPMTVTDPSNFVRNPIRFWLQLMSQYRATITAAPNSAYEACARLAALRKFEGLNLSACRAAFWGAELIHSETVERFYRAFSPYGFRAQASLPVYGLAEATLAVTVSDIESAPVVDRIPASLIESNHDNHPDAGSPARQINVICVGRVLANHQLRIVDGQGKALAESQVGGIEVAGPSIVDGFWEENEGIAPATGADGYLSTGDLGYLRDGELYVIGRKKEIIIVRGENFIPDEIESCVAGIVNSGIQKGVAAVGLKDARSKTESVHILIESRVFPPPDGLAVEEKLRHALAESLGLTGVFVHWLPKGKIPKTTSGKIQRFLCRELAQAAEAEPDGPSGNGRMTSAE